MKALKVLFIFLLFGILSCSTFKGTTPKSKYIKGNDKIKNNFVPPIVITVEKPIIQDNKNKNSDAIETKPSFDFEDFNNSFNKRFNSLLYRMDSLANRNADIYKSYNQLQYDKLFLIQENLNTKERLLIERENRVKAEKAAKEGEEIKTNKNIEERYISLVLLIGILANILFTIGLHLYKIRLIKKLNYV